MKESKQISDNKIKYIVFVMQLFAFRKRKSETANQNQKFILEKRNLTELNKSPLNGEYCEMIIQPKCSMVFGIVFESFLRFLLTTKLHHL